MRHLLLAALLTAAPAAAAPFEEQAARELGSLAARAAALGQAVSSIDTDEVASASVSQGPCEDHPRYQLMTSYLDLELKDQTKRTLTLNVNTRCRSVEDLLAGDAAVRDAFQAIASAVAASTRTYVNQYAFCYRKSALITPLDAGTCLKVKVSAQVKPLSCASIDVSAAVYEPYQAPAAVVKLQCSVVCRYRDPMGTMTSTVLAGAGTDAAQVLGSLASQCRGLGMMSDNEVLSSSCR